jgi:large subunit ribosomal protein L6
MPVVIPAGVQVSIDGLRVQVQGPKGQLERSFPAGLQIERKDDTVAVARSSDEPSMRAKHGLTRALIHNMVLGVSQGFAKELQIEGVGYRAELEGKDLMLYVGFSHPVRVPPPAGIQFDVDAKTRILKISGPDKDLVGQMAADIRKVRPPEPYKGKGIRYVGEHVRHKAGKAGKVS